MRGSSRLGLEPHHGGGERRAALERDPARQRAVQQQAHRIEVGLRRGGLTEHLLRGHVRGRARERAVAGDLVGGPDGPRDPEVGDHRATRALDEDVCGLEVAVHHARVVSGGEPVADLSHEMRRALRIDSSFAGEDVGQALARHQLHRQVVEPGVLADVEGPRDVAVRDVSGEPHLLAKARQAPLGLPDAREHLERDLLPDLGVEGQEHHAHAAAA